MDTSNTSDMVLGEDTAVSISTKDYFSSMSIFFQEDGSVKYIPIVCYEKDLVVYDVSLSQYVDREGKKYGLLYNITVDRTKAVAAQCYNRFEVMDIDEQI